MTVTFPEFSFFARLCLLLAPLQVASYAHAEAVRCPLPEAGLAISHAARAEAIFWHSASRAEVYQHGNCASNVWRLLRVLEACGAELPGAKVLYFVEEGLNVTLEHTRAGSETWYFHVVLEHGGKVFDFDYADDTGVPDRGTYFLRMFRSLSGTDYGRLEVRVIPAEDYRTIYDSSVVERSFYYFLFPHNSSYLQWKMSEFLRMVPY